MRLLLEKEFRELARSRAYWLLLLMMGPLAGHAFITAVDTYAEMSRGALAQGLSPLDGILTPTLGAYDIAATLLFPFVAIRLISSEKESGAWKLMLQAPFGLGRMLTAKAIALTGAWCIAGVPGLMAIALWKMYGGSLYTPETLNLTLGHLLRALVSAGVAVGAASIATSAASAAIATLGFTVGTWALEFIAEGRGGWLATLAAWTPTAALRVFEQGELRLSTALVMLAVGVAGFVLAAIWLAKGAGLWKRAMYSCVEMAALIAILSAASTIRASWDVSENRRHSFSEAEETALRRIREPVRVTVNLAPEDPRLADLNRNVLSKLARVLPKLEVEYAAHGRSGLFEGERYGQIWWETGGRRTMSRSTTEAIVLENLFRLAQVPAPAAGETDGYKGHAVQASPRYAALVYYLLWPLVVVAAAVLQFRA